MEEEFGEDRVFNTPLSENGIAVSIPGVLYYLWKDSLFHNSLMKIIHFILFIQLCHIGLLAGSEVAINGIVEESHFELLVVQ